MTRGAGGPLAPHAGHALRWDARGRRWWWAGSGAGGTAGKSAAGNALHAYAPDDAATLTVRLSDPAGLLVHCASGRLLLGLPKRLCLADPAPLPPGRPLRVQALAAVDPVEPRTRISDGCTDRRGFLVFGTANAADDRRPIGSFYQFSRQHGLRRLALPAVAKASSIGFSQDGTRMVFADAHAGDGAAARLMECTYDAERGAVSGLRVFATLEPGLSPRGAVFDAAGCLWHAQSGQLVQYSAEGKVLRRIAIDCAAPAFGGPQLSQLMVAGPAGLMALPAPLAAGCADVLFDDTNYQKS